MKNVILTCYFAI